MVQKTVSSALDDAVVIALRARLRAGDVFNYETEAKRLNVGRSALGRAMRGATHDHLNRRYPPVRRRAPVVDQTANIVALFKQGVPELEICRRLRVGKNTVTTALTEVRAEKKQAFVDMKAKIIALYLEGSTPVSKIASDHGLSEKTVFKWVKGLNEQRQKGVAPPKPYEAGSAPQGEYPYNQYRLYHHRTGKQHRVRLRAEDGSYGPSISLRQYLMEVHLGRHLLPGEKVVFIQGDENVLSNLRLVTADEVRITKPKKTYGETQCLHCHETFVRKTPTRKYCSTKCSSAVRVMALTSAPFHTNTCEICEGDFRTRDATRDICYKKSCHEIVEDLKEGKHHDI